LSLTVETEIFVKLNYKMLAHDSGGIFIPNINQIRYIGNIFKLTGKNRAVICDDDIKISSHCTMWNSSIKNHRIKIAKVERKLFFFDIVKSRAGGEVKRKNCWKSKAKCDVCGVKKKREKN
jgi:hypothetical protein